MDDIPRDYPAWNGLARAVLPWTSPLVHLWEGHAPTTTTPLMRKGYPLIPLSRKSLRKRHGGRGNRSNRSGSDSDKISTLEEGRRKRMGSLVRSRFRNLGSRRVILTMWPMPLGNGPIASCIITNTMRIPTSCP